ncbi:MAG: enoyl-CoA hydratase/isomerase family protein [Haloferacaceae archaeon]
MTVDSQRDASNDHVARLRIDTGDLNLLNPDSVREIRDAVERVPDDVSVLVLGGPGDAAGLTAGLDLSVARDFSVSEARTFLRSLHGTIRTVRNADAVTVCECGEYALGAGLELAMACDFRVATAEAALGLPEVDVGLVTGIQGGLLVRLVGLQAAKELVYTGEPVSGREAAELGLVNEAPPADAYADAVERYVSTLAAKSPHVLREQKRVFRSWRSVGLERGMEHSLETIAACFDTPDQTEAMSAFLEGRDPSFEDR